MFILLLITILQSASGQFYTEELQANSDCKALSSAGRGLEVSFTVPAQPQPHQLQTHPLLLTVPSWAHPQTTAPDRPPVSGETPACLAPGQ